MMSVHRLHPHVGPWPYGIDAEKMADRGIESGQEVPLMARLPLPDSKIYDDPDDALLYDDCERCSQHADHPMASLDDDMLQKLSRIAMADLTQPVPPQPTATQHRACEALRDALTADVPDLRGIR